MEELAASMHEVSATITNIGEVMSNMNSHVAKITEDVENGLTFSHEISGNW